jgi:hypothetical protein
MLTKGESCRLMKDFSRKPLIQGEKAVQGDKAGF